MPKKDLGLTDLLLVNYAKAVDNIDMCVGPIFESAQFSDSYAIKEIAMYARILEYAALKLPFVAFYIIKTKDYEALIDWIPKEMFALSVPYGGYLDLFRRYEKRVFKHYGLNRKKDLEHTKFRILRKK